MSLKMKVPAKRSTSSQPPVQPIARAASNSGYQLNPHDTMFRTRSPQQELAPQPRYFKQENPEQKTIFDDSTIDSGFDNTKSDIALQAEDNGPQHSSDEYGGPPREEDYGSGDEEELTQMEIEPPESARSPAFPSISGRFQNKPVPQTLQYSQRPSNLQLRPGGNNDDFEDHRYDTKKRNRSNDRREDFNLDDFALSPERQISPQYNANGGVRDMHDVFRGSSVGGNSISENPATTERQSRIKQDLAPSSQGQGLLLSNVPDYDDKILEKMSLKDLMNEPFNIDPRAKKPESPPKTTAPDPTLTLGERITNALAIDDAESQEKFFNSMSIDEWEDSGDWFLEQFGDLLKKLKEKRREKRAVVKRFEAELQKRESDVRERETTIDDDLLEMKRNGTQLLSGRSA